MHTQDTMHIRTSLYQDQDPCPAGVRGPDRGALPGRHHPEPARPADRRVPPRAAPRRPVRHGGPHRWLQRCVAIYSGDLPNENELFMKMKQKNDLKMISKNSFYFPSFFWSMYWVGKFHFLSSLNVTQCCRLIFDHTRKRFLWHRFSCCCHANFAAPSSYPGTVCVVGVEVPLEATPGKYGQAKFPLFFPSFVHFQSWLSLDGNGIPPLPMFHERQLA